jgi:hypothetical protein
MPKVDQNVFFHTMESVKTPTRSRVDLKNSLSQKDKFSTLKSHDYNNLIRFMLPIAIRGFVTKWVHQVVFRLVRFFCWVCSKNVDVKDLDLMRTKSSIMTLIEISQNVTTPFVTIGNL